MSTLESPFGLRYVLPVERKAWMTYRSGWRSHWAGLEHGRIRAGSEPGDASTSGAGCPVCMTGEEGREGGHASVLMRGKAVKVFLRLPSQKAVCDGDKQKQSVGYKGTEPQREMIERYFCFYKRRGSLNQLRYPLWPQLCWDVLSGGTPPRMSFCWWRDWHAGSGWCGQCVCDISFAIIHL